MGNLHVRLPAEMTGFMNVLQLAPLLTRFRERVENAEVPLEESVRTLSYAADLVLFKLRWLLPNAKEEEQAEEALDDASGLVGATILGVMEPCEVPVAAKAIEDRMKASARMFTRGYVPSFEGGRRLEIVNLDPWSVRDAMKAMERRTGQPERVLVVARWSFVTHLKGFWREVRRLAAKGVIVRFSRFLGKTRQEAILNFLAFLELVKRRRLFARQKTLFGDIEFSTSRDSVGEEGKGP